MTAVPSFVLTEIADGQWQIFVNTGTIGEDEQSYLPYNTTIYTDLPTAQTALNTLNGAAPVLMETGGDQEEV